MAQLAALLRTDLSRMAEEVRRAGRGKDTILAHITPREAALLKSRGGAGTINPATGLPEFQQDYPDEFYIPDSSEDGYYPPNMPTESQGNYRMVEGEYSTEPPGPTYTPIPYVPMSNMSQDFTQAFDYSGTTGVLPPRNLGVASGIGAEGFGGMDIDQGFGARAPSQQIIEAATAPQENTDLQGVLKRGGDFLKTPLGYGAIGAIPAI